MKANLVRQLTTLVFVFLPWWAQAADATWQTTAQSICQRLQKAQKSYVAKDINHARIDAVMAYFKMYDIDMEPAARVTFGNAHVFQIEQQFSQLPKLMANAPSAAQSEKLNKAVQKLCQDLKDDAKAMDKQNVKKSLYQTGQ